MSRECIAFLNVGEFVKQLHDYMIENPTEDRKSPKNMERNYEGSFHNPNPHDIVTFRTRKKTNQSNMSRKIRLQPLMIKRNNRDSVIIRAGNY